MDNFPTAGELKNNEHTIKSLVEEINEYLTDSLDFPDQDITMFNSRLEEIMKSNNKSRFSNLTNLLRDIRSFSVNKTVYNDILNQIKESLFTKSRCEIKVTENIVNIVKNMGIEQFLNSKGYDCNLTSSSIYVTIGKTEAEKQEENEKKIKYQQMRDEVVKYLDNLPKSGKYFYSPLISNVSSQSNIIDASEVKEDVPEGDWGGGYYKRTHDDGWTIYGFIHNDWYSWVTNFGAEHEKYGRVWAHEIDDGIHADSKEAFDNFISSHPTRIFDHGDI